MKCGCRGRFSLRAAIRTWTVILAASLVDCGCGRSQRQPITATTPEGGLRQSVTRVVQPLFPLQAILDHDIGVAVADVHVDAKGHVVSVQVLEAPAQCIAQSVSAAVRQWQFKPFSTSNGAPVLVSSLLTFYFEIEDGKGVVLDPDEAGYVGRWPLKVDADK